MESGNRDLMDILLHGESEETSVQQSLEDSNILQATGYGQGVGFASTVSLSGHAASMQSSLTSPVRQQGQRFHPMSPTQVMQSSSAAALMQQGDMMGAQYPPSSSSYADSSFPGFPSYQPQQRMPQASPTMDSYPGYNQNGSYLGGSSQGMSQYGTQSRALGHSSSLPSQYSPGSSSYGAQNYYHDGYPSMPPKSPAQMQSNAYAAGMLSGMPSAAQMLPMSLPGNPGSSYPSTYTSRPSLSPVQKQMSSAAQTFFPSRSPVSQQIHSPPGMGSNYPGRSPTSPMGSSMMGPPSRSTTSPVSIMMPQALYTMPQQYSNPTVNQSQQQSSCMYAAQRLEKMSSQHQYKAQMAAASGKTPSASSPSPTSGRRTSYPGQQNHIPSKHPMPSPSAPGHLSGQGSPVQRSPPQVGKSPPPFQAKKSPPSIKAKKSRARAQDKKSPPPLFQAKRSPPPFQAKGSPPPFQAKVSPLPFQATGSPPPFQAKGSPPLFQAKGSPPPFQANKSPPFHARKSPAVPNPFQNFPSPGKAATDSSKSDQFDHQKGGTSESSGAQMEANKGQPAEKTSMQKLEELGQKLNPKFAEELMGISKGKVNYKEGKEINPGSVPGEKGNEKCEEDSESSQRIPEEQKGYALPDESPDSGSDKPTEHKDQVSGGAENNDDEEKTAEDLNGHSVAEKQEEKGENVDEKTESREEPDEVNMERDGDETENQPDEECKPQEGHTTEKVEEKHGEEVKEANENKEENEEDTKMDVDADTTEKMHPEAASTDPAEDEIIREVETMDKGTETPREMAAKPEKKSVITKTGNPITTPTYVAGAKGGATPTIQATVIAKGQTAHTNQQVLVAKTASGQMYLIQGNVLIPVQNITVQQPRGEHGGKVICVNQGQGKSSKVIVGNITQNISNALQSAGVRKDGAGTSREGMGKASDKKKDEHKEIDLSCREESITSPSVDSDHEGDERMSSISIQTDRPMLKSPMKSPSKRHGKLERKIDALKAKLEQTSTESSLMHSEERKRLGRPRGSKDKNKRKPYSQRKSFHEEEEDFPPEKRKQKHEKKPEELARHGKPTAIHNEPSTSHKRQLTIDIPTVSKTMTSAPKKRKVLPPPAAPSRILTVQPRGGGDRDKWCCALCGKASNCDSLGVLYGPYKAKLSRERRDGTSRECRSPEKLTSPSGKRLSELPIELEGTEIELWVHKDCGVWSQGIYMLGQTLYGLEQAVETAASHKCSKCTELGATLVCFRRGCNKIFHFACARDSGCAFVEENFTVFCSSHKCT